MLIHLEIGRLTDERICHDNSIALCMHCMPTCDNDIQCSRSELMHRADAVEAYGQCRCAT